jgi:hypothetical protein
LLEKALLMGSSGWFAEARKTRQRRRFSPSKLELNRCKKKDMQHLLAMMTTAVVALLWIFMVFAK